MLKQTRFLLGPQDEGSPIYRVPGDLVLELFRLEDRFAPIAGGPVLFENRDEGRLTSFAVRLFRKGYVSFGTNDPGSRVLDVLVLHPEIEARILKVFTPADDAGPVDDLVIPEADLPFEGAVGAAPVGMHGHGPVKTFGNRPGDHPAELLENLLYGKTDKDDPESSHHAEHQISEGL